VSNDVARQAVRAQDFKQEYAMKTTNHPLLWATPLLLAGLGASLSACGPQDGSTAAKAPVAAAPVVAVAEPAPAATPVPQAAPAPQAAPQPAPAPVAKPAPKPAPVHTQAKAAVRQPVADKMPVAEAAAVAKPVAVASANLGAVQEIETLTEAAPSGAGAVVGGLLGGVVGHQFGKGDGRKAMTVVGAVGGAVAGHQIEKSQNRKVIGYRVKVHLDNGDTRTFEPTQLDGLKVGDRVRIDQGALHKA
jgi:outer membrane lipoprotein SlyB